MTRQEASLLSLPDELLDHIFDFLAEPLQGPHPLVPVLSVCRRVYKIVKPLFYRDVVLGAAASRQFQNAVKENPSVGQLVSKMGMYDTGLIQRPHGTRILARERVQATIRTLSQLRELTLHGMTTGEANAVLATLPSPSLRSLKMRLHWTTDPQHQPDLWTHLACHLELRVLECSDWASAPEVHPRTIALAAPHFSLPKLEELHTTDRILVETFETAALSLRDALPSLRTLHITIPQLESISAVSAILSHSSSSLTSLKVLSKCSGFGVLSGYLSGLPPLRHLDLGPQTFIEDELIAYLPTATLESIGFGTRASVTDRILQALTGTARPPPLRQIRLDHVSGPSLEETAQQLEGCEFGYCYPGLIHELLLELRNKIGPIWPNRGTEKGLRLALVHADANGIQVTGSAVDCAGLTATPNTALAEFMLEQVEKTEEDLSTRFAPEVLEWLKKYVSEKADRLRANMSALEFGNAAT